MEALRTLRLRFQLTRRHLQAGREKHTGSRDQELIMKLVEQLLLCHLITNKLLEMHVPFHTQIHYALSHGNNE